MRFLKFLFIIVLIGGIAAGMFYTNNVLGWNWSQILRQPNSSGGHAGHQQPTGGHGAGHQASPFNTMAGQNRDKLMQALTSINQAMELVTSDPYSQITMPSRLSEYY